MILKPSIINLPKDKTEKTSHRIHKLLCFRLQALGIIKILALDLVLRTILLHTLLFMLLGRPIAFLVPFPKTPQGSMKYVNLDKRK